MGNTQPRICKEFKQFRQSQKMSQKKMVMRCKTGSKAELSRIENGIHDIQVATLMKYLAPLGYMLIIVPRQSSKTKVNAELELLLKYYPAHEIFAIWFKRRYKLDKGFK